MKRNVLLYTFFLLCLLTTALAQTDPDANNAGRIVLKNKTFIIGEIMAASKKKITYRPAINRATVLTISTSRVHEIRYDDGRVVEINKPNDKKPTKSRAPKIEVSGKEEPIISTTSKPQPIKVPRSFSLSQSLKSFTLTFAPEASYMLTGSSPQWADENAGGLGLRQGVGGSVRINSRIGEHVGLALTGGFQQWQTKRNFVTVSQELIFSDINTATSIPLSLGLKIYPLANQAGSGLYLMPEAGITYLMLKSIEVGDNKTPIKDANLKTTYGAGIGFEVNKNKLVFDLSLRYQIISIKAMNTLQDPIHYVGARVGVGFGKN